MKTGKQIAGKIGEDLAWDFYKRANYKLIGRNYLRKWGEIDLIVSKEQKLYFVEVKTITRYTCNIHDYSNYRAEDNIHFNKRQRLKRVIQTYLANLDNEKEWQFDVVIIVLNKQDLSLVNISKLENVIL